MPAQSCPHYPENTTTPTSRCRACGQQVANSTSEGQPAATYPGVKPASGTAIATTLNTGARITGKQH